MSLKNKQVFSLTPCGWNLWLSSDRLSSEVLKATANSSVAFSNSYLVLPQLLQTLFTKELLLTINNLTTFLYPSNQIFPVLLILFFLIFPIFLSIVYSIVLALLALVMQSQFLPPAANFYCLLPETHHCHTYNYSAYNLLGILFFPRKVGFEYSWTKQWELLHTALYTASVTGSH